MFYTAECMAEGAWQLVTKPEILNAAWDEFRKTEQKIEKKTEKTEKADT